MRTLFGTNDLSDKSCELVNFGVYILVQAMIVCQPSGGMRPQLQSPGERKIELLHIQRTHKNVNVLDLDNIQVRGCTG